MAAEFEKIIYEKEERLALITINRPDVLNCIDPQTSHELHSAFCDFRDDDQLWVAILTGAGERSFSTGNDLVAMAKRMAGAGEEMRQYARAPFGGITRNFECWKPIIAAINGYCLAGGMEIAASCDLRVAAESAQFGVPEVTRGIIPGASGTQRLPRMLPKGIALELLMTGARFDSPWALRHGFVNYVVPFEEVLPRAREMAQTILKNAPLAVRAVKESALRGLELSLEEGLKQEVGFSRDVTATEDAREGPRAFAEKRPPEWQGR